MRTIIACLITLVAHAQVELENHQGIARMQKVIEVAGRPAADLYAAAYKWLGKSFKNPDEVLKGHLEGEMLRGQGSDMVDVGGAVAVQNHYQFNFLIEVKDGRVRITLDQFVVGVGPRYSLETYLYKASGEERTNVQARTMKKDITADMNALISSLESYLVEGEKGDDW